MRRFALLFLLAALPLMACSGDGPPPAAPAAVSPPMVVPAPEGGAGKVLAYWVQLGPGGTAEARAVMSGTMCPWLIQPATNNDPVAMTMRAAATSEFSLLCSASLPAGIVKGAMIRQIEPRDHRIPLITDDFLALPVSDPQRILVLGDTGCRLKGAAVQACNDPAQWPFPVLAGSAAKLKPDLVIHLGDYLYRENACPAGNAGCAGTPFGDNWPTWNADFFEPAAPLLAAAPWITVRGNHEDCARAGAGWERLLGPVAFDRAKPCSDRLASYSIPFTNLNIVVMDNASAPDTSVDAASVPAYRGEIAALANEPTPSWLVLHRPIWAAITGPLGLPVGGNATLIDAAGTSGIPKPVELMLAGHIHSFEAINYTDKAPPQIVAGNGGDNLDVTPKDLSGAIFQGHSGISVKDGLSVGGFGFLLMTKATTGWNIQLYDQHGKPGRMCIFAGGRVDCPAPTK